MNRYIYHLKIAIAIIATCCTFSACKKNFADINTNPQIVTVPDIKFLFTYSEDQYEKYQGTEWVWETMEQLFRYTQHATAQPYENYRQCKYTLRRFLFKHTAQPAGNKKTSVLEARFGQLPENGGSNPCIAGIAGLKVTDMNGSIAYSQADRGRYDANFNPVYDAQEVLLPNMLAQLNSAITVLSNTTLANQNSYGNSDVYYSSDWIKWVRLANTLKLRIAARLDIANNALTKTIFQQVLQDPNGAITGNADQLSYQNIDYEPFGREPVAVSITEARALVPRRWSIL